MAHIPKASTDKLLWLDMEMTGLEVEKEVPIEVAAIITDFKFKALSEYHAVIHQPKKYLDAVDDWNKKHHGDSGLLKQIEKGKSVKVVDSELSGMIKEYFGRDKAMLAGNSIGQDRLFIQRYMPDTEKCLHYRMLDVTSYKIIFNNLYGKKFEKKDAHRAVDDIRESIAELQFYLSFVKV
jgi:oligoribonuclease